MLAAAESLAAFIRRWVAAFEPPQELCRFAEADDCSDDTRRAEDGSPNSDEASKPPSILSRNYKFESSPLQQRVFKLLVPRGTWSLPDPRPDNPIRDIQGDDAKLSHG